MRDLLPHTAHDSHEWSCSHLVEMVTGCAISSFTHVRRYATRRRIHSNTPAQSCDSDAWEWNRSVCVCVCV